jgi:hypothetical protein
MARRTGAPADIAIVENDGILHGGVGMNAHAAANHRSPHQAAGKDGSAGNDGIKSLAAAAVASKMNFAGASKYPAVRRGHWRL